MQETDGELVAVARAGDKAAFGELIERHQARAIRAALDLVHNADAAQEVVQEAILQAYLSLDRLRDEARFASWLHGIVVNLCHRHLRDRQRCLSWESLEEASLAGKAGPPDPAQVAEQREQERFVREAVQALSPSNRDATRLFYYEQMSVQEVAAALGISPGAVKVRLHQSRKQLKERLLTLYPEAASGLPGDGRRSKMTRVDVVRAPEPQDPTASEEQARRYLIQIIISAGGWRDQVCFMEEGSFRFLPLHLGRDAHLVWAVLENTTREEQTTGRLMPHLLKAIGTRLEEVRIERLKDEISHAMVRLHRGSKEIEIAARPGEATALALQVGAPILVAQEIMAKMSWDLSDPLPVVERIRQTADEAALARAAEEPIIQKVAQALLERGIRQIQAEAGYRTAEVVLETRRMDKWTSAWLSYRDGRGSWSGGNISLPLDALPVVIAHFKRMASMDLAQRHIPQQGRMVIEHQGQDYDVTVCTEPGELNEKLTLCLRLKAEEEPGTPNRAVDAA